MSKCLKCEKEIELEWPEPMLNGRISTNLSDGGDLEVNFAYGSRHDMCAGFKGFKGPIEEDKPRHHNLLRCDYVRGFICDDCFEKHADLFHGYNGKGEDQYQAL